jgi:hypothetical protein
MANDAELVGNITDVSEKLAASIFRAVDEDSSADTLPIHNMASHPRQI